MSLLIIVIYGFALPLDSFFESPMALFGDMLVLVFLSIIMFVFGILMVLDMTHRIDIKTKSGKVFDSNTLKCK